MVRAIIFDCFGVLATDRWQAFLEQLPGDVNIEAAREAHRAYDAGIISKQECGRLIHDATGRSFTELEDIADGQIAKNTRLLEYIRELHRQGYHLGILSNISSDWVRTHFLSPEEQACFDDFVFSYEVGMVKPDPRMYTLAAERLDADPTEVFLIDDKERYCSAAREVGMQAIWYQNFAQMKAELEAALAANK